MDIGKRLLTLTVVISVAGLIVVPLVLSAVAFAGELVGVSGADLSAFAAAPGLMHSAGYSMLLALVAPLLACYIALAFSARAPQKLTLWLSPLLAIPHLAFAVGVLFLFSPSGWLIRLLHEFTGAFPHPADWAVLADRSLSTLLIVLLLKEIPFLLLMIQSARSQVPVETYLRVGQSLGYSCSASWWHLVVPELMRRLTLPMAAVVIYTLSVVDIPLLLGPNLPGVLAQQVFQWQQDFSEIAMTRALLGSFLLLLLGLMLLGLNSQHQQLYRLVLSVYWRSGWVVPKVVHLVGRLFVALARLWMPLMALVSVGVVAVLVMWSLAAGWFYPDWLPHSLGLETWRREWPYVVPLLWTTLGLAVASASVALLAAVVCLEKQQQGRRWPQWPMLLGLLVPQLPLVMGWQFNFSLWQLNPHLGWVFWSHCIFAFPYAYLVLAGDYQRYDRRWLLVGQSLGYSPWKCWVKLLLPMMRQPLLYAWVIAFSVSIAQYLPTQLLGAGRVVTLTTEAINVSSGGDRQILALYALWQFLLPLMALLSAAIYLAVTRRSNA